ncbi:hypothetical protein BHM03_00037440, partial [Ensete ventricosum]
PRFAIPDGTAHTERYVPVHQLTGAQIARYRAVPLTEGGRKKKEKNLESIDPSPAGDFFSPREEKERGDWYACMYRLVPSIIPYRAELGMPVRTGMAILG